MKNFLILIFILFSTSTLMGQPDSSQWCVMFYNTENFFDPTDDSLKNDDTYTVDGMNRWSNKKMYHKRDQIAKVILSINGWNPPDLIGLAEIENDVVLKALIAHPGLRKKGYRYIHFESPDSRGIDVALLYRGPKVTVLDSYPIPIQFPFDTQSKNREILYVKVKILELDTVHLYVNHWTSRFGGAGATIVKRDFYAQVLRHHVDSILNSNPNSNIVIMGDFNDYPTDNSLYHILNAREAKEPYPDLVNLMLGYSTFENEGTHKNEAFWGCLDQFIISKSFYSLHSNWKLIDKAQIYKPEFLLVPDEKYGGVKTYRTYLGFKYLGGFSDHLPVYLVIQKKHLH